jgi:hypothetical protein
VFPLKVELTRRSDGDVVLRCTRADGSATWLGLTRAFYGLIAAGWDIADTEGKGRAVRAGSAGSKAGTDVCPETHSSVTTANVTHANVTPFVVRQVECRHIGERHIQWR